MNKTKDQVNQQTNKCAIYKGSNQQTNEWTDELNEQNEQINELIKWMNEWTNEFTFIGLWHMFPLYLSELKTEGRIFMKGHG